MSRSWCPLLAAWVTMVGSSSLLAQRFIVSPPQAVNVEGTSSSGLLFSYATTRQQQVDSNLIGQKVALIKSLAFRQSNSHSRTGAVSRTIELQIDMGYGVASPSTTYDNNYKANTRKTVFTKQNVSLPDWTKATPVPAPFSLKFSLSNLFVYSNKESLVWDLIVTKNSSTGQYYVDWLPSAPAITKGTTPQVLGTGCTRGSATFTHTTNFTADSTNLMLSWGASNAPPQTPVLAAVGLSDPNLNLGWCTNLRTDALLFLPVTSSNASGSVTGSLSTPWVDAFAGILIYSQVAANDPGPPAGITLSNGLVSSTPFARGGGGGAALKVYGLYNFQALGPTGTTYINAIPVEYEVL